MHTYLLAHDLGTSGDKAVLFDTETLSIAGDVVKGYTTYYPQEGWVEHVPEDWWSAVCDSSRLLIEQSGIKPEQIAAVSFSAIMNSCLPVDTQGVPLRKAMIWCDQRGISSIPKLYAFASENTFYEKTGHRLNGTYAVAKMLWFRDHEKVLFDKTYMFLQAKDYIVHKLTGIFASDYTDASHLGILDQKNKCYWKELLSYLEFPLAKFPPLYPSTSIIGYITSEAAKETGLREGTPVVIGGGDGCCATAGAGVYRPGLGYNILGTSSWNGTISDSMLTDPEKVTFSFIYLDGKHYMALGTMQSAGHSLEWLLRTVYPDFETNKKEIFDRVNTEIESSLTKKDEGNKSNLIYLPYLMGERSPWWNSNARGCFIGLNASTTSFDMLRSCMEGVAFNLKVILDALEVSAGPLEMRIIGGGARNNAWLKIIASVWDRTISVPKYLVEATSLGAILCAGIGVGIFPDFSVIEKINPSVKYYEPDRVLAKKYKQLYPIFLNGYHQLIEVFEQLQDVKG
ncbi:FGGY-family carbohydrate kinase [uncultured Sphaerochaeta sp.]|uniref:xylulokinase n=1 Tax=uncultured Sphaerochaeta sp. TaxID=886478 RepID=UPI002A0A9FD3|nr:FGGY-family carbohydrate kinase [uncultured Sphaerochaeta sp.]